MSREEVKKEGMMRTMGRGNQVAFVRGCQNLLREVESV